MRCQICDAITENCSFDKETSAMTTICDKCNSSINETIGEDQMDDEDAIQLDEGEWFRL